MTKSLLKFPELTQFSYPAIEESFSDDFMKQKRYNIAVVVSFHLIFISSGLLSFFHT